MKARSKESAELLPGKPEPREKRQPCNGTGAGHAGPSAEHTELRRGCALLLPGSEAAGAALCTAEISLCHAREHSCLSNASEPSLRPPPSSLPKPGVWRADFQPQLRFDLLLLTAGQETLHKSSRFCSYQIPPSPNHCQPNSLPIPRQPLAPVFAGSSPSWAGLGWAFNHI